MSVRAVLPTIDRTWRCSWRQLGRATTGICASCCMCRWNLLCRSQRPTHTHWAATTHRHGMYDSANRPVCVVARACAQRGRCRVHTCQCLPLANQRTNQAETQPRGIHGARHAQAERSSTIGFHLGLCLCLCVGSPRCARVAKNWGNSGSSRPKSGLHLQRWFSLTRRS